MAEVNIQPLAIIERMFSNWTALRMAVEHGMGSNVQAHRFCEYVAEFLTMNEQLCQSEVAAELEDYMDAEFNTQLEDESEKQVAEDIVKFHRLIVNKDLESLQTELAKLPNLQPWIINQGFKTPHPVNRDNSESDSDDDNMDSDNNGGNSSKKQSNGSMEVDEDGWAVVRRKK